MIKKFRKKPVVIEAVQWVGDDDSLTAIAQLTQEGLGFHEHPNGYDLIIYTLEGHVTASSMDWIIKGIKGECYPCKPDIFKATYDSVNEE